MMYKFFDACVETLEVSTMLGYVSMWSRWITLEKIDSKRMFNSSVVQFQVSSDI